MICVFSSVVKKFICYMVKKEKNGSWFYYEQHTFPKTLVDVTNLVVHEAQKKYDSYPIK